MKNVFAMVLACGLLTVSAAGCGDPCISRCEEGKDMGCVSESTDCEATCEDAERARATLRADAETTGCVSEFEASVSCMDGRPACETTGCEAEASALTECTLTFCTANPSSDACM